MRSSKLLIMCWINTVTFVRTVLLNKLPHSYTIIFKGCKFCGLPSNHTFHCWKRCEIEMGDQRLLLLIGWVAETKCKPSSVLSLKVSIPILNGSILNTWYKPLAFVGLTHCQWQCLEVWGPMLVICLSHSKTLGCCQARRIFLDKVWELGVFWVNVFFWIIGNNWSPINLRLLHVTVRLARWSMCVFTLFVGYY